LKKFVTYLWLVFAWYQTLPAQEVLIQWTGVVRDELLQPVPYAHIIVQKDMRGTVSDPQGKFTIITYPRDTLLVSCLGYRLRKIPVPSLSYDDSKHYIKDVILMEDTIKLSEVLILPWKTYLEFREAFLTLNLPEDDLERAYRNIAVVQEQIYNAIMSRPASPASNFRDITNSRTSRMMTYGHMYPTYAIANPIAWAQFFQALRNGEFNRKENATPTRAPSTIEEMNKEKTNP